MPKLASPTQSGNAVDWLPSPLKRLSSVLAISLALTFVLFLWIAENKSTAGPTLGLRRHPPQPVPRLNQFNDFNGIWDYARDKDNLQLNLQQCDAAFPSLFAEVDRAVNVWQKEPINESIINSIEPQNGFVRAMIYDQKLYVIAKQGGIYSRDLATLHAIHRAILTSPEAIPNIEFAFNSDDRIPSLPLWGYARRAEDTNVWLMPDFGYWSWPETKVGSMDEVRMKATQEEESGTHAWKHKVEKLLWRGATMGLSLRERLLEVTCDKSWADVVALDWHDKESMTKDLRSMPQHCQNKYLMQTEGNSYSGRLKYLQNCNSVIVSHPLDWIEHHHHLMRADGAEQNYVEVKRSFEDLEEKIAWLRKNDKIARKIAHNSVKTFRERYLTPAAETCYWRKLMHGWAKVSWEPRFYDEVDGKPKWRGLPIESFLLERRLQWDPY